MMTKLLNAFEPYRKLLKIEQGFTAKTGTLTGVNSLAGYFTLPNRGDVRFVILINSDVPPMYKFTVASAIRGYLESRDSN
jgi:D-alanyl-D-alanine carboxypeptidase